ncbi:haloacid dehalogenase superfamily, subfamily IA, variant 3 with third motif having DD or ED/haloacid dehalogenase superfamily, subfamily IA, variant 1 with third motif having Dx(3-4)D or Dx(3-4)E [Mycolicibacterium fluoranthenivorans]|uniref:HAD superfamily hydrolase (TIGR01509 family) n=1 Tax=Mycolicibacterium fluoranthenivorans TaxID=258505 RepID=A0A1G4WBU6_9MYCO|nr:HAD superfamily hydrolase (TIGR01509 family) [Mycolicibacterium fluoranthenivorans]SCX20062.1 haloacid dehalogenase superfamily, subfamily IA, variant 3 with third motif having DD or ED/haloacid dehalogenase superfamily, subfamily IA, variant 1 with third motif having Dx(3-4)D or Dx(3-4)E [Mycolicibacterium fluoranthenivorans]
MRAVLSAVLFDMDGTLVDSEKLWDVGMHALYGRMGGVMTEESREATVGGSAESVMLHTYRDLGLEPDPAAITMSIDWLHAYVGELFEGGLPWCDGARELLDALHADGIPMALVTNTRRHLTEKALDSIGRHYFSVTVCADEVPRGKPAPDPYRRAAHLLGLPAEHCLAVEDSITGTAAAEAAGCPVLVVPNDIAVPTSPRRHLVSSLVDVDVATLRDIHSGLATEVA